MPSTAKEMRPPTQINSHHRRQSQTKVSQQLEFKNKFQLNDHCFGTRLSSFCWLVLLIIVVDCLCVVEAADHLRLSTQLGQPNVLFVNDSLVSTLGTYRATLEQNKCQFRIRKFSPPTLSYSDVGFYRSKLANYNCSYLKIITGQVQTQQNFTYFFTTVLEYNHSTILTIDDLGVIRIVATVYRGIADRTQGDLLSYQVNFTDFREKELGFVYSATVLSVEFFQNYGSKVNLNNWNFSAQNGELQIKYGVTPSSMDLVQYYFYQSFVLNNSRFFDFNYQSFPGTILNNISYHPTCSKPKNVNEFRTPFTIEIDPYWPMLNFYEQGRYKILELSLARLAMEEYATQINDTGRIYHFPYYSPCPKRTFQLLGDCVAVCPEPFYHEIRGDVGKCVLTCQDNSFVLAASRICECMTPYEIPFISTAKTVNNCTPVRAGQTPFGCVCKNDYYYDYTETLDCVLKQKCPNKTYPYKGLCMQCPPKCTNCTLDTSSSRLNFLKCLSCESGYSLAYGLCKKDCLAYNAKTPVSTGLLTQTCVACVDRNCFECTGDGLRCLRCSILYSLWNGTCVETCGVQIVDNQLVQFQPVYAGYFSSVCMATDTSNTCMSYIKGAYNGKPYLKCDKCLTGYVYQDRCVASCPSGTYLHQDRYCVCQGGNVGQYNLTIYNQCSNLKACPITLSFDSFSHSCISCSFGCISCMYKACTSCYPGFFLLLSPQQNNCRRLSPLTECKKDYEWVDGNTCRPKNYSSLAMANCYNKVPNCQICQVGSNEICLRCQFGYAIYNNTCLSKCPEGMMRYQQTCVLLEIGNCSLHYLMPRFEAFVGNDSTLENSAAYQGYLNFSVLDSPYSFAIPQDPVGYIPIFLKYGSKSWATGYNYYSFFYQPYWTCTKCNPGYGLSPDRRSCLPCPSACSSNLCYYARNSSCINEYTVDPTPINCPNGYIDLQKLLCLQSCNVAEKYPFIRNGQLYCLKQSEGAVTDYIRVDSAAYRQNAQGEYIVYFVFDSKVRNISTGQLVQSKGKLQGKEQKPATVMVKSIKLDHNQKLSSSSSPRVSQTSTSSVQQIVDGQYIKLKGDSNFYSLTVAASQLQSSNNLTFPNQLYGSTTATARNEYMRTWLAYIGYVMAITILLLHWIYIGLGHLYKMDNLIIMTQGIFYFLFVKLLVGRLLTQFYWGWGWMHGIFLPNLLAPTIPEFYVEEDAPPSYKLVSMDGNYFRNAGFSLVWLLIFFAAFLICVFFVKVILHSLCRKIDIWYPETARQAGCAIFEFFSMNLFFFSVAQLRYSGEAWKLNWLYYTKSQALAILTIIVIILYTVIRFIWFNRIGGLYMFKRILLAAILVTAYQNPLYLIPTILLQLLFLITRFRLEQPQKTSQKFTLYFESCLFILCYLLMFLCIDTGVNAVIISIVVFVFIVYLAYDLTVIYLEARDQYQFEEMAKIYEKDLREQIGFRRYKIDLGKY